jgi:hypothetical protein
MSVPSLSWYSERKKAQKARFAYRQPFATDCATVA